MVRTAGASLTAPTVPAGVPSNAPRILLVEDALLDVRLPLGPSGISIARMVRQEAEVAELGVLKLTAADRVAEFDPNLVEVQTSALRRKLEQHGPRLVHTVRGVGYRLHC